MAIRDLLPMGELLKEVIGKMNLKKNQTTAVCCTFFEENNGALKLALSPWIAPRTKHISTNYHLFRSKVGDFAHLHINSI